VNTHQNNSLLRECLRILGPHRGLVALSAVLGVANGLCVTALLATVGRASSGAVRPDMRLALELAALCVLIVVCNVTSNLSTAYVGQRVLASMRCGLAERILTAPIAQLERFGSHRLMPVLVHDTGVLNTFILAVAPLIIATTITVSGIVYLTLLSWKLMSLTLVAAVIGIVAQWLAYQHGKPGLEAARHGEDLLQKQYEAISDGAKELRIQRPRRHHVRQQGIQHATRQILEGHIVAAKHFVSAEAFGSILFFVVIGVAIFLSTVSKDFGAALGAYILVMLYLKGPMEHVVNALPQFTEAQVAMQRITQLSREFSTTEPGLLEPANKAPELRLDRIELRELRYAFAPQEDVPAFELGPINLTISRGDITFIIGENGSGKTTLIKLLLGLYQAQQGHILLNGKKVTPDALDDYRQLFTTTFADCYVFDELPSAATDEAQALLERLELAHKVHIRSGSFSTTSLSTGQRKRLALVNAWMEARPILLFDEWAADQDPAFRRYFYTQLLPDLQRQGKTVIVISHDDRYFDIADQLIRMESGKPVIERRTLARTVG
jgi:putative pyoverdin transport system ATP-binding/permease protein